MTVPVPAEVAEILSDSLTPRGIQLWWFAGNRMLRGQQPVKVAEEGDLEAVVIAAHSYVAGHYI
jgi:hypothetical protein